MMFWFFSNYNISAVAARFCYANITPKIGKNLYQMEA
jgi:hypothetical protein